MTTRRMTPETPPHRRALWVLIALTAALMMMVQLASAILGAVNTQLIRDQQKSNTNVLSSTDQALELLQDCTLPEGDCYQRGQETASKAVGDIGQVTVFAAACAAPLDRVGLSVDERASAIEKCVRALLDGR